MTNTKNIIRRIFCIISFLISAIVFGLVVMTGFSLLTNNSHENGVEDIVLGMINGGAIVLFSVIGIPFSVLSLTLTKSKTVHIISTILICFLFISLILGFAIFR